MQSLTSSCRLHTERATPAHCRSPSIQFAVTTPAASAVATPHIPSTQPSTLMECSSSKICRLFSFSFFYSCCASRAILRCSVTLSCARGLELEKGRQTISAFKSRNTWEIKCTLMFIPVVQCLLRQSFVCVVCCLVARGSVVVCYVLLHAAAFVPRCPAAIGRFMAPSRLGEFPRQQRWDRVANRWHGPGSW
jgi:hypothetical protein